MQITVNIQDTATPAMNKMLDSMSAANRRSMLAAAGAELISMTKGSFNDSSLRPTPWAPLSAMTLAMRKRNGHHGTAILKASGALWHSIRRTELTANRVSIGTDRPYAGVQQFGARITVPAHVIKPKKAGALMWPGAKHPVKSVKMPAVTRVIPPRPFMPLTSSGTLTPVVLANVQSTIRAAIQRLLPPR